MKRILAIAMLAAACGGSTPSATEPTGATGPATTEPVVDPTPAEKVAEAKPPEPPKEEPGYKGLGEESVSAETIKKFAAPPLDQKVSARIQAMLDIRGTGGGLVTSKGDRVVFSWRVTGTSQIWRQDGPMKFPVQLTGGEDNTSVVDITPDDKWLVVQRDKGGAENPGLYLQSIEGGPLVEIQHKKGVQTHYQFLSQDGKSLYYRANDPDPGSYAIYRYDLGTRKAELVTDEKGLWAALDRQGNKALFAKLLGNTNIEIYELDLDTKKFTHVIGQGEAQEHDARYGARPGTYLVSTNKLGEFHRLYELKDGKLTAITPDIKWDVSDFIIDEARTRIIYMTNENGYSKVHAIDAKSYKPIATPKLPAEAENVYGGATTRNGRFTNFGYDSSTTPSTTITYDWKTRKSITWRVPSTPEVDLSRFAKVTVEYYPARDGTKIPMLVRRPEKCKTELCPVVVDFHGGPEGQSRPGFSGHSQLFVDAGFIFVEPNVRGSVGYGKSWLHADNAAKRLDIITDIEDAAIFIKKEWARDGKAPKVGVMGGSYGGYSSLMAMTYFAGAYDAGVAEVGISNLYTFLMNTAPYRRILRTSEYGDPETQKDILLKLSPVTYIDRLKAPLLIIQGVNDPRVPVGEAVQMHEALAKKGIDAPLILFADEGHGTSKRSNQVLAIGHTLAFFEQHLK